MVELMDNNREPLVEGGFYLHSETRQVFQAQRVERMDRIELVYPYELFQNAIGLGRLCPVKRDRRGFVEGPDTPEGIALNSERITAGAVKKYVENLQELVSWYEINLPNALDFVPSETS